jgi:ABC-type multidrug transport system ATPase subunit
MCLAADALLYVLDEPTAGLDPIAREQTWVLIKRLVRSGKTVIFSTHYMDEAQRVTDEVAMLVEGKIVSFGTVQSLMECIGGKYRVEITGIKSAEVMSYGPTVVLPESVRVFVSETTAEELVTLAASKQFHTTIVPASLEDAFLMLSKSTEK